MDYTKNEVKFRLESILERIDNSGVQESCIIDEEVAIEHNDLLQHIYGELEEMIGDIDLVGIEEDDFDENAVRIMEAKEALMKAEYMFSNKEVFPPLAIEYDTTLIAHINYLKMCNYHFFDENE